MWSWHFEDSLLLKLISKNVDYSLITAHLYLSQASLSKIYQTHWQDEVPTCLHYNLYWPRRYVCWLLDGLSLSTCQHNFPHNFSKSPPNSWQYLNFVHLGKKPQKNPPDRKSWNEIVQPPTWSNPASIFRQIMIQHPQSDPEHMICPRIGIERRFIIRRCWRFGKLSWTQQSTGLRKCSSW